MGPTKQALTDEVWGLLAALMVRRHDAGLAVAESCGLSMGDTKALLTLGAVEHPPTMSALAEVWGCDASNVTWLVDRLEQGGCVVRRPSTTDRRSKTVELTGRGRAARDRLLDAFTAAPAELHDLSVDELAELVALLHKIGLEACDVSELVHAMGQKPRSATSSA